MCSAILEMSLLFPEYFGDTRDVNPLCSHRCLFQLMPGFASNLGAGTGGESLAESLLLSCVLDGERKNQSMQLFDIKSDNL